MAPYVLTIYFNEFVESALYNMIIFHLELYLITANILDTYGLITVMYFKY